MLLEAMGEKPPAYAHLPLILGADKTPLSKAARSLFRGGIPLTQGYVREALCNYLALLGWSLDGETTLFSVAELVDEVFAGARRQYRRSLRQRKVAVDERALHPGDGCRTNWHRELNEYLAGTRLAGLPGVDGKPTVADLVPLVQEKMKTLADFVDLTDFFFLPLDIRGKSAGKAQKDANAPAGAGQRDRSPGCP